MKFCAPVRAEQAPSALGSLGASQCSYSPGTAGFPICFGSPMKRGERPAVAEEGKAGQNAVQTRHPGAAAGAISLSRTSLMSSRQRGDKGLVAGNYKTLLESRWLYQ